MNLINNVFFDRGAAKAREGMSLIRPIELHPMRFPERTVIYRFYDSNIAKTVEEGMQGVWWMEFTYFQQIKHFAARNGYSQSYAARLFAAIMYEFSEVNAYVACEVIEPLHAWKGKGKQVESIRKEKDRDPRDLPKMTPMQSILEIYQLCIPGLSGAFSIASKVLRIIDKGAI